MWRRNDGQPFSEESAIAIVEGKLLHHASLLLVWHKDGPQTIAVEALRDGQSPDRGNR